jgi:hypothetical protein
MSASTNPHAAATHDAHKIVEGIVASILGQIKAGEVTEDTLSDCIFTEVDDALIYTADQWVCAYGLRDVEDAIEEGLCEPKNFGEALAAQAFCNLQTAVGEHDFSEAFAVAEDTALESGEVTP